MKIERLKEGNNKKYFVLGVILTITLVILINMFISRAKYQVTESVNIAKGTISYSSADLNIMQMFLVEDGQNKPIDQIPGEGYKLNNQSYCSTKGVENDTTLTIEYVNNKINISNMTKKGTKCYIYFENYN